MTRFRKRLVGRADDRPVLTGEEGPWIQVSDGGLDVPVLVRVGWDRTDEKLVCTGVIVGGRSKEPKEVTARSLRIPLAAIVDEIAAALQPGENEPPWVQAVMGIIREELAGAPAARPAKARYFGHRPGARGHGREFYVDVARQYREALESHPRAPVKALAEQYPHHEEATVRYWLRVIRERYPDLLPPHAPGKAVVKASEDD